MGKGSPPSPQAGTTGSPAVLRGQGPGFQELGFSVRAPSWVNQGPGWHKHPHLSPTHQAPSALHRTEAQLPASVCRPEGLGHGEGPGVTLNVGSLSLTGPAQLAAPSHRGAHPFPIRTQMAKPRCFCGSNTGLPAGFPPVRRQRGGPLAQRDLDLGWASLCEFGCEPSCPATLWETAVTVQVAGSLTLAWSGIPAPGFNLAGGTELGDEPANSSVPLPAQYTLKRLVNGMAFA